MNHSYQLKSLEEMQEDNRKKNQVEADILCQNICLCIGWISLLGGLCYIVIMIIVIELSKTDRYNSGLIVEKAYTGSYDN